MARGWESKSVESQREDAALRPSGRSMSQEERERSRRRDGLELDRLRIARELRETASPLRRASLEQALAFLDAELSRL
jgi:hypothetical protein